MNAQGNCMVGASWDAMNGVWYCPGARRLEDIFEEAAAPAVRRNLAPANSSSADKPARESSPSVEASSPLYSIVFAFAAIVAVAMMVMRKRPAKGDASPPILPRWDSDEKLVA
eukprot:GFYU01005218.1.p3 GENE.GFYU01005218.1~~GFYU01005218.1.p3  ORF type:complete len:113 (+),score=16.48 GFYU01005218.1:158-496(+)